MFLSKKPLILHINSTSHVDKYIDNILTWCTNLNTAPLSPLLEKPRIPLECSFNEKIRCNIYQSILNQM
jgi:hypothetical protein